MKLSTKEQYAIKAMINLAINNNNNPVTLTEISSSLTISLSYLEQLFSTLRRTGLVQGVRGPGGGYRLGKAPDQISIADIIKSLEESAITSRRTGRQESKNAEYSFINNLWNQLSEQLLAYLDSISLADIIKDEVIIKSPYRLDETTRRISTMFPVTAKMMAA